MNEKEDCSRLGCFRSCWVIDDSGARGSKTIKVKAVILFETFPPI